MTPGDGASARAGILLVLLGVCCISVNDMLIKRISGDYPLHQIVFLRSAVAMLLTFLILRSEGGLGLLRTRRPGLHAVRALLLVGANMAFFAGLAVLSLAEATALFFVAPLLITLLSIPLLGERVGPRRIGAVLAGLVGVVVMLGPGAAGDGPRPAQALPILAALFYALMQILTRKLGAASAASAMALYLQATFLVVGALFFLVAGDGRFAVGLENESLRFLLRAWAWPADEDLWIFAAIGGLAGVVGYSLSQAYRLGDPASVAPFEYAALPLAVLWGVLVFGDVPGMRTWIGIVLIAGSGLYVFLRESRRGDPNRPVRRA